MRYQLANNNEATGAELSIATYLGLLGAVSFQAIKNKEMTSVSYGLLAGAWVVNFFGLLNEGDTINKARESVSRTAKTFPIEIEIIPRQTTIWLSLDTYKHMDFSTEKSEKFILLDTIPIQKNGQWAKIADKEGKFIGYLPKEFIFNKNDNAMNDNKVVPAITKQPTQYFSQSFISPGSFQKEYLLKNPNTTAVNWGDLFWTDISLWGVSALMGFEGMNVIFGQSGLVLYGLNILQGCVLDGAGK